MFILFNTNSANCTFCGDIMRNREEQVANSVTSRGQSHVGIAYSTVEMNVLPKTLHYFIVT